MRKLKFYCNMEDLNEEEKRTNRISYRRLIDRLGRVWLFNKAPELSNYDFDFEVGSDYDEETEEYTEVYQYYLIDISSYDIEKLNEIKCNDVIIAYSETLEEYVLFVTHFGTSWDYVMTDFEPTEDLDEADL